MNWVERYDLPGYMRSRCMYGDGIWYVGRIINMMMVTINMVERMNKTGNYKPESSFVLLFLSGYINPVDLYSVGKFINKMMKEQ